MNLDDLLACFETGAVPLEHWDHAAHLRVAAWAVTHRDDPLAWMRTRLWRLLDHHGIETTRDSGYHETITAGWLRLVAWKLGEGAGSWEDRVAAMVEAFGDKRLMLRFWSREVIMSQKAREGWVEPDLAALPDRPA